MKYKDLIHGIVNIEEPVIIDLINSPFLQRLKSIDQAGYSEPYFPGRKHNRFEHSIGDYLLLRKFGASIEEQINGLIHDVSHSAFSHCIDYILDSGSQTEHDLQDNIFNDFIMSTDIPSIIKSHGLDLDYILNDKNFPLQEKELPDLCADRIDYSLRTAIIFEEATQEEVNTIIGNLFVKDGNWIFLNYDIAKKYAGIFFQMNKKYYSGLLSGVMFLTVGDYFRYALKKRYIKKEDLYLTDQELLDLVLPFHQQDNHLQKLFNRMDGKTEFINNKEGYYSKVSCKSRIVDPLFHQGDSIKRVSEVDAQWKEIVIKESQPKEYYIGFKDFTN